MAQVSVLTVDPDKLFEKYTVDEVESVLLNINGQIEKKKEELRTLVGERYRDLIETADTISEMKLISEQLIKEVQVMNREMGGLRTRQAAFRPDPPSSVKVSTTVADSLAAQMSVLLDLPELVWSALSSREYTRAARLYLFGRHIRTGLRLDKQLSGAIASLPVLDHLWSSLSHFPVTILSHIQDDLQRLHLSSQEGCTCLCGMALLDSADLTDRFLSLRYSAIEASFTTDNVKARIIESHQAILTSLNILWDCFAVGSYGKQLFWKQLRAVCEEPVAELIEPDPRSGHLPPIVRQFRATSLFSKSSYSAEELARKVEAWLVQMKELVSRKGRELLANVVSLRSLQSLTNIHISGVERGWEGVWKGTEGGQLWSQLYSPLTRERASQLITEHSLETFSQILDSLHLAFSQHDPSEPDDDLRWFVWSESADDMEVDKYNNVRKLLLKTQGITPKVARVCSSFEQSLLSLSEDLSGLYTSDISLASHSHHLRLHQQKAYMDLLLRLKEHCRSLALRETTSVWELSVLARFLLAVPQLCPSLHKCLTISADLSKEAVQPWEEARVLLESEGLSCWAAWEARVAASLSAAIPTYIRTPTSYQDLLTIIPQWDVVWIEEGEGHRSQLQVPSGPSLSLQNYLHHVCTRLGRAHLPRQVSENVVQRLVPDLLDCYNVETALCQAGSLQNLFDVKYLLLQTVLSSNKELSSLCHQKIAAIERLIDPFDLDVFAPHIAANVKASVHRTRTLLGMTEGRSEDPGLSSNLPEDPSVLAVSSSAAWFPLIPVSSPVSKPLHLVKPKSVKVGSSSGSNSSAAPQPPKPPPSASSFLIDWFS